VQMGGRSPVSVSLTGRIVRRSTHGRRCAAGPRRTDRRPTTCPNNSTGLGERAAIYRSLRAGVSRCLPLARAVLG
jgi:hypothetical protein